jgi:hypothetical protein
MRIAIEYQFSDRNYTRFVSYTGSTHENKKWNFSGYLYSESDLKNQSLQQNLTQQQALILANSGDKYDLMVAPSAYVDTYSENKVLYRKNIENNIEIYEYSNNPLEELYAVHFSLIGPGKGNYNLKSNTSLSKIFEYIAPVNTVLQGNYEPIIQLIAPTKIQVATLIGNYKPAEKTAVDFEMAISNKDLNLFSTIDDNNNKGMAGKINARQRLYSRKWQIDAFANYQLIQENFKSVERLNSIEFNRDWNLGSKLSGNQSHLTTGFVFKLKPKSNEAIKYQFEKLDFSNNYSGSINSLYADINSKNWTFRNQGSILKSDNSTNTSQFFRNRLLAKYNYKKNWIGSTFRLEDNQEKNKTTNAFTSVSQKFSEYGISTGHGDSTQVFVELAYLKRNNDSLQKGMLTRVNSSDTYIFKSKLIQTEKTQLAIYTNYRVLQYTDPLLKKDKTLNSRILYSDRFLGQLVQNTTAFETNSGSMAQQEFTYLEVPAGQGVYTWNDYNGNTLQELQEFEIAPFVDLAKYIRIFLPNQFFVKTNQTKLSQSITLNPIVWQNNTGIRKKLSYLYNQSSYLIDRKIKNEGSTFNLNPFLPSDENTLGLSYSLRNSLYYNRGKQNHSMIYSYVQNNTKNLLSIGSQEAKNNSHQIQYTHLYKKNWLFNFFLKTIKTKQVTEYFTEKNTTLKGYQWAPKLSYLFSKNKTLELFYEHLNKENRIGKLEKIKQNRLGTMFSYASNTKFTINGELSYYINQFKGDEFSAVGFQLLEGLQAGKNLTWRLLLQKNITRFLDINLNYLGRKSEANKTIHTGNIQMRAYF